MRQSGLTESPITGAPLLPRVRAYHVPLNEPQSNCKSNFFRASWRFGYVWIWPRRWVSLKIGIKIQISQKASQKLFVNIFFSSSRGHTVWVSYSSPFIFNFHTLKYSKTNQLYIFKTFVPLAFPLKQVVHLQHFHFNKQDACLLNAFEFHEAHSVPTPILSSDSLSWEAPVHIALHCQSGSMALTQYLFKSNFYILCAIRLKYTIPPAMPKADSKKIKLKEMSSWIHGTHLKCNAFKSFLTFLLDRTSGIQNVKVTFLRSAEVNMIYDQRILSNLVTIFICIWYRCRRLHWPSPLRAEGSLVFWDCCFLWVKIFSFLPQEKYCGLFYRISLLFQHLPSSKLALIYRFQPHIYFEILILFRHL